MIPISWLPASADTKMRRPGACRRAMCLYCCIAFSFSIAVTSISYIKDKVTINVDLDANFPTGRSPNICCLEHYLSFKNENYNGDCLTLFLRNCLNFLCHLLVTGSKFPVSGACPIPPQPQIQNSVLT